MGVHFIRAAFFIGNDQDLLNIKIEVELIGMRAHPDRIYLPLAFVFKPNVDHVLGEHSAFEQELVISFKRVHSGIQGAGNRGNVL